MGPAPVRRHERGDRRVICDTKPRHRAKEVLTFFKLIDPRADRPRRARGVGQPVGPQGPRDPPVAGASQTGPLASALTPTSSSWLNLVEAWFNLSPNGGYAATFSSVDVLVEGIETWPRH
jgi:hypothetical protein